MDEWKRSGQIPAFGDWDHANELPITQYFECARQAGLIRYSNSSGECDQYMKGGGGGSGGDLYSASDLKKPGPPRKGREKRWSGSGSGPHVKEQHHIKKQQLGKVCDVTEQPRKHHHQYHCHQQKPKPISSTSTSTATNSSRPPKFPARPPKPVDEDLYKIPPELLRSSKRKKMPGFFSCLVPACAF